MRLFLLNIVTLIVLTGFALAIMKALNLA